MNEERKKAVRDGTLLNSLLLPVPTNKRVKDGQDVTAVLNHARENVAQARLALGLAVPLGEDRGGNFNVTT